MRHPPSGGNVRRPAQKPRAQRENQPPHFAPQMSARARAGASAHATRAIAAAVTAIGLECWTCFLVASAWLQRAITVARSVASSALPGGITLNRFHNCYIAKGFYPKDGYVIVDECSMLDPQLWASLVHEHGVEPNALTYSANHPRCPESLHTLLR